MLRQVEEDILLILGEYLKNTTQTILPKDLYPLFPILDREVINDSFLLLQEKGYIKMDILLMGKARTAFNLRLTPEGISYYNEYHK